MYFRLPVKKILVVFFVCLYSCSVFLYIVLYSFSVFHVSSENHEDFSALHVDLSTCHGDTFARHWRFFFTILRDWRFFFFFENRLHIM